MCPRRGGQVALGTCTSSCWGGARSRSLAAAVLGKPRVRLRAKHGEALRNAPRSWHLTQEEMERQGQLRGETRGSLQAGAGRSEGRAKKPWSRGGHSPQTPCSWLSPLGPPLSLPCTAFQIHPSWKGESRSVDRPVGCVRTRWTEGRGSLPSMSIFTHVGLRSAAALLKEKD